MDGPLPAADCEHVLAHGAWDELRGARLFVTGGTGFVGRWLLETLLAANARLGLGAAATVLSRDPAAFRARAPHLAGDPAVTLLAGDVRTFDFPGGQFSHIIHAATDSSARLNAEQPLLMFDTIVEGTRHVLDSAVASRARAVLFTSSGAVYGRQPADMARMAEDYPGAPDPLSDGSAYGEGKRAAELLCRLCADKHGLDVKIARLFAFVGPHLPLDRHYAAGNFVRDALAGGPVRVQGDGTPVRSYLYAADLAAWLWTILARGRSCRPYNVGSDEPVTVGELARETAGIVGPDVGVEIGRRPVPGEPAQRYVPSVARARAELGLDTWVLRREALRRTAEWYRGRG